MTTASPVALRWRQALTVVALGLTVVAGACGDGGRDSTDPTTTPAGDPSGTPTDLSSYDDIGALHQELVDQGIACGLEYSGLRDEGREVSICVIVGEQALLTVWDDPNLVTEFADSDAAGSGDVAHGENWTVDVDSPETAQLVADALGGTVSTENQG
jgi:hypothetical protein